MFKHLLLPTDGSELSQRAVTQGIDLAKALGARVTAFHAIPRFHILTYDPDMLEDTRAQYERDSRAQAEQYLAAVQRAAEAAGVCPATRK